MLFVHARRHLHAPRARVVFILLVCAFACAEDERSIVALQGGAGGLGGMGPGGSTNAGAGGSEAGSAQGGTAGSGQAGASGAGGMGNAGAGGDFAADAGPSERSDAAVEDAGNPGAGGSSVTPATFCEGASPSTGVDALDHACADFENGIPADWVSSATGSASATLSEERAFSPVAALRAEVPAAGDFDSQSRANLRWSNVGAQGVARVSVRMQVNPTTLSGVVPAWTGSIALACIEFGSGEACVRYSRGGGPSDLFVEYVFTGGPAFLGGCESTETLDFQLWNELEFTAEASGALSLLVNGQPALNDCSTTFQNDTSASVSVGLETSSVTSQGWSVFFDDIVAEITRQ